MTMRLEIGLGEYRTLSITRPKKEHGRCITSCARLLPLRISLQWEGSCKILASNLSWLFRCYMVSGKAWVKCEACRCVDKAIYPDSTTA